MLFIDQAEIHVQSGKGGDGCVSFRREKYVPKGGPNGGDGGAGGSVVIRVNPQLSTLVELSGRHHWHARPGQAGGGDNMSGRTADDVIVEVPAGTMVYDRDSGALLRDLVHQNEQVIVARGGRGGRGNARFASSTHQTPREAEKGGAGEERWLRLELKLIAEAGLVGLPNAGKSTLLSRVSKARPKIADYPFTTLVPNLGIVSMPGYRQFVMADLPGLIEGAAEGHGLGQQFLRHAERTRVIVHVVDIFPLEGQPRPIEAYRTIRSELEKYSSNLAAKPEIIVANKMDLALEEVPEELREFQEQLGQAVLPISGVSGQGIEPLVSLIWDTIQKTKAEDPQ